MINVNKKLMIGLIRILPKKTSGVISIPAISRCAISVKVVKQESLIGYGRNEYSFHIQVDVLLVRIDIKIRGLIKAKSLLISTHLGRDHAFAYFVWPLEGKLRHRFR